jgi:hypothetical protein
MKGIIEMTTKQSCAICCENNNCSTHKPIACDYCQFEACRECCQTYLLSENTAKCMNTACGKEWSRKFIAKSFTAAFISKKLKAHREQLLFEREQAMMPATQPYAEYLLKMKAWAEEKDALLKSKGPLNKIKNEVLQKIAAIKPYIHNVKKPIHLLFLEENLMVARVNNEEREAIHENFRIQRADLQKILEPKILPLEKEISLIRDNELRPINRQLRAQFEEAEKNIIVKHRAIIQALRAHTHPVVEQPGEPVVIELKQFIKPCPADDCRGYLSRQWKCGLCDIWSCPDCHVVIGKSKETPHECDPNDVETAKMLKAETKPCPKCHSAIFKIDGCDQIWCTQCHTAFSWKTGKIETKIHNPHYYEWLRKTQGDVPRDPLDRPCGHFNQAIVNDIYTALIMKAVEPAVIDKIMARVRDLVRNILHLTQSVIPGLQPNNYEIRNRNLRVDYMTKKITEGQYKKRLQQKEKSFSKNTELRDVYQMVATTGEDVMIRFVDHVRGIGPIRTNILDELNAMTVYANECLADISKTYGCVKYVFLDRLKHKSETVIAKKKANQGTVAGVARVVRVGL